MVVVVIAHLLCTYIITYVIRAVNTCYCKSKMNVSGYIGRCERIFYRLEHGHPRKNRMQQYTAGYRKVRKEVSRLMGGQVLTEIEPIKSYLRGMREGRAEGKIHTLVHLVNKQMLSVEEAAREAGVSEEEFRRIQMNAPDL